MNELPLVLFTVLGQTAAGAFVLLVISKQLNWIDEQQMRQGLSVSMLLMVVGIIAGASHVGMPLRMFNMMGGLGRSPMSNEIMYAGCFASLGTLTVLGWWLHKQKHIFFVSTLWVAAMMAILFVLTVPQLYRLETVPAWNTAHTSIQMLLTALICGGALAAAFGAKRSGGWVCIAGIVAIMVTRPDYFGFLNQAELELYAAQTHFWVFQAMMFLAGLFVLLATLFKQIDSRSLLGASASAMIFGELAGRIAFYNLWSVGM